MTNWRYQTCTEIAGEPENDPLLLSESDQAVVLLSIGGRLLRLIDNEEISESLGRLKF